MASKMSEKVVNNDNNNLASSLFLSLFEITGDCFGALVFLFYIYEEVLM